VKRPWGVSVVTLERAGATLALQYDDSERIALLNVPTPTPTLQGLDEAKLFERGRAFAERQLPIGARIVIAGAACDLASRAYFAGYISRLDEDTRTTCRIAREQLAALVRVATAWPIFDMRHPLIDGAA